MQSTIGPPRSFSRSSVPAWLETDSQATTRQASRDFTIPEHFQESRLQSTSPSEDSDVEKARSTKITSAADWTGPDDPDDPHNWPSSVKYLNVFCISMVAFIGTFSSSVYTPGIEDVQNEFKVSFEKALVPYSIFVGGLAFGAPFAAPLSETVGRRLVYALSIPFFSLWILGSGFANNIWALCWCRFFAGVFAAPTLSVGSATLADMWPASERAVPMTIYVNVPFLGPALGPLIGGYVVVAKGWRWTQWTTLFFIAAALIPLCFMRETYKKKILQTRAKRLNLSDGPPSVKHGKTVGAVVLDFVGSTLTRPIKMFLTEPVVFSFTCYIAYNFSLVYMFFPAFQFVFEEYYDFSLTSVGLTFIGIGSGCISGCILILLIDRFYYQRLVRKACAAAAQQKEKSGESTMPTVAPEHRLETAMLGGILMVIGLFWFGWTAAYRVHWISPVLAEAVFGCGNQLTFMTVTMYTTDFYGPLYGASAMAANTMLRYIVGAGFPMFSVQMFRGLGVQWACTLLGCLSIVGATIPFFLYKFGPRLRQTSHYAHGD